MKPFPWLRHGAGASRVVTLWVVMKRGGVDAVTEAFARCAARGGFRAAVRSQDSTLAVLTAKQFGAVAAVEASLERALIAAHARAPIALVVRANPVTPSEWHRQTVGSAAVFDVLERLLRASPRYVRPGAPVVPPRGQADLREILLATTRGNLQAEVIERALSVLSREARTKAGRSVFTDQVLERVPAWLGFEFDSDLVLREVLASARGVAATAIEMGRDFHEEVARRTLTSHQGANAGREAAAGRADVDWSQLGSVRAALTAGRWEALERGLVETNPAHRQTLLALTAEERLRLVAHGQLPTLLANIGLHVAMAGDFAGALRIYDAAVEGALNPDAAANPLYVVQNDNNHLGIDPVRSRRYLERCLPHAERNPTILLNAAFVQSELGSFDDAVRLLGEAKARGIEVKKYRHEALFEPLRARADFKTLMR